MESLQNINIIAALKFSPELLSLFGKLPWQKIDRFFLYLVLIVLVLFVLNFLFGLFFLAVRIIYHRNEKFTILEITPPQSTQISPVSTTELLSLILDLVDDSSLLDRLILKQSSCSFEIVSSKKSGIRFLLRAPENSSDLIRKNLQAYILGIKIKEVEEYISDFDDGKKVEVLEFKTGKHFSLPIDHNIDLNKHDPIAYLASNMSRLGENDLIALQIVARPIRGLDQISIRQEISRISRQIKNKKYIHQSRAEQNAIFAAGILESAIHILLIPLFFLAEFVTGLEPKTPRSDMKLEQSDTDKDLAEVVKSKIGNKLFETSIRVLLVLPESEMASRAKGLCSSFSSYLHLCGQSLTLKSNWRLKWVEQYKKWQFIERFPNLPVYLSTSELAALYHFPYAENSQTEDLVRAGSKDLPAPLSLKNAFNLDVVFGQSTFGNTFVDIGLTDDDRSRHVYLIGQTGSGKTTIIYHIAKDDIGKGRGLAVIDPHGDLAEDLLNTVPEDRANDLIYFNPFDIKHPIGINLLELTPNLDDDDLELEKELVCEGIVSIFRRVFFKDELTDAHRIEYILRNTIYTAFTIQNSTIFTVYDLLNDANFRKSALKGLRDENLINFWKNEFGKAGDWQHVKMVGGVTAKIGRFLFSPIAKRILEQPKSTINFDDIMDKQKIMICNLAEGRLGEDTSMLLGATIIAKFQQATVRRARTELTNRKPFYLFVDEFQNFATSSFTKLLSGGRKFGLRITIAEQSTAQQSDRNVVNVILANTGTVICFRTASPIDEDLMLAQLAPQVSPGDIANLPRYHFYMKISATNPEAPLSGKTLPMLIQKDQDKIARLVEASRENYAVIYKKPNKPQPAPPQDMPEKAAKTPTKSLDSSI